MNKKILLLILLVLPIRIYAYYDNTDSRCDNKTKVELKNLANEFQYRLERNTNNTYDLLFYNLSDKLEVYYNDIKYESKISGLDSGKTITLVIKGSDETYCYDYKATTKTITIPYYNKYYNSKLCEGYEGYYLCQENSNIDLTEEEFKEKLNEYINSNKKEVEDEPDVIIEEPTIWDMIMANIYYIYGALVFILIILMIIIINNRIKEKKGSIL